MLGSHVLDPRFHGVQGEGAIAVVGQAEKGCRLGMLRVQVIAQVG